MKELNYSDFKKAIEIVSGKEISIIFRTTKSDGRNRIQEVISLNGIWFSIGDDNDSQVWSIDKINFENDGKYEIIKVGIDLCDCVEHMAYLKEWFNTQGETK